MSLSFAAQNSIVIFGGKEKSQTIKNELAKQLPIYAVFQYAHAQLNQAGSLFPTLHTCRTWDSSRFVKTLHQHGAAPRLEGFFTPDPSSHYCNEQGYPYAPTEYDYNPPVYALSPELQRSILREYHLYASRRYWNFVEQFPCYQEHILELDKKLSSSGKLARGYNLVFGDYKLGLAKAVRAQAQHIKRKRQHAHQQKVQGRLREQRNQKANDLLKIPTSGVVPQTYQERRHYALESMRGSCKYATKQYTVTCPAQELMRKYSYAPQELEQCYGDQLQHAIHQEFVDIVTIASGQQSPHEEMLMQFVDAGVTANIKNECAVALKVANFCWGITTAAGEGAVLGLERAANMFLHPIQTAQEIGSLFHAILKDASVYCDYGLERCLTTQLHQDYFINLSDLPARVALLEALDENLKSCERLEKLCCNLYERRKQQATNLAHALLEHSSHMEARDFVREGVAFVVDAKVSTKLLKACSAVLNKGAKHCAGQIEKIRNRSTPLLATVETQHLEATLANEVLNIIERGVPVESKKLTIFSDIKGTKIRYSTIAETGEKCRLSGPKMSTLIPDWEELAYEKIRQLNHDIKLISLNTGIQQDKINIIKNHLFYDHHLLCDGKLRRFDGTVEIAEAWDRLVHGDFIKNDLKLLEHEYHEFLYMKTHNTRNYTLAHNETMKKYDWIDNKYLKE